MCFLSDRQKSPEFYAIKNVNKKKPIAVFKKKIQLQPPGTADPKKVGKIEFDFCHFFLLFCVGLVVVIISTQYMPMLSVPNFTEMRALLRKPAISAFSFTSVLHANLKIDAIVIRVSE